MNGLHHVYAEPFGLDELYIEMTHRAFCVEF